MSTRLRELRRRIGSAGQIQKVTGALQRVAAARLSRDRQAIVSSQLYTRKLIQHVWNVCAQLQRPEHPLMQRRHPVRRVGIVAFGAERGLCGSFTTDLVDRLRQFVSRRSDREHRLITVGQVMTRRCRRTGFVIDQSFGQPALPQRAELISTVAASISETFAAGDYDEVHVLYSRFAPALQQVPLVEQVLPVQMMSDSRRMQVASFEPTPTQMLERLIPEYVRQMLDHGFLNSAGAENAARQTAMSRASRNAQDMIGELSTEFRHLRQESITTEMLELAGGGTKRR